MIKCRQITSHVREHLLMKGQTLKKKKLTQRKQTINKVQMLQKTTTITNTLRELLKILDL